MTISEDKLNEWESCLPLLPKSGEWSTAGESLARSAIPVLIAAYREQGIALQQAEESRVNNLLNAEAEVTALREALSRMCCPLSDEKCEHSIHALELLDRGARP